MLNLGDAFRILAAGAVFVVAAGVGAPGAFGVTEPIYRGVTAGSSTVCGITVSGGVNCWGEDFTAAGAKVQPKPKPEPVRGLETTVSMALGRNRRSACAVQATGQVYCWGDNDSGQLGWRSPQFIATPRRVPGIENALAVAIGTGASCALLSDSRVSCWGSEMKSMTGPWHAPELVPGLLDATSVSVGMYDACATRVNGLVSCWGQRTSGRLHTVPGITGARSVSADGEDSGSACAVLETRQIDCWGSNFSGQLGDGSTRDRSAARPIARAGDFVSVGFGETFACALGSSGVVWCWGTGYLASGPSPRRLGYLEGATKLSVGSSDACVLTAEGSIGCWGFTANPSLSHVTLRGTTLTATISCPSVAAEKCAGQAGVRLALRPSGTGPNDTEAKRGPSVASVRYSAEPGGSRRVRLSVPRGAKQQLARAHSRLLLFEAWEGRRLAAEHDIRMP